MPNASLNPDSFLSGFVSAHDEDISVKDAIFHMFDYGGKGPTVPAARLVMERDDGSTVEENLTVGSQSTVQPSPCGKFMNVTGPRGGFGEESNFGIFITSLLNAGFPADRLGEDITVLNGLKAHVMRIPLPKRTRRGEETGGKKVQDALTVTKIITLPGEDEKKSATGAGKKKAGKKGSGKAAAKDDVAENDTDDELTAKATEAVLEVLNAADGGPVAKNKLLQSVFTLLKNDPDKVKVCNLLRNDDVLSDSFLWTYENGKLELTG